MIRPSQTPYPISPKKLVAQSERDKSAFKHELFSIVSDHLKGTSRDTLQGRLQTQCDNPNFGGKSAVSLYKGVKLETEADLEDLKELIRLLYPYEPNRTFTNLPNDLYGCLEHFSREKKGHRHLEDFNHLLFDVHPRKSPALALFTLTILTGGLAVYLHLVPEHLRALEAFIQQAMPVVWDFLHQTFSILKNIPLLLMLYNFMLIPIQSFSTYQDTFRAPLRRFQRWLVGTLPPILTLIAYGLGYLAGGVITPLAAAFFISSSLVDVVNSACNLFMLNEEDQTEHGNTLEKQLDHIRYKHRLARTKETILVNLIAAVCVATTVTLWCTFPPSFLMMIGCIAFINLVNFTRGSTLNLIHTSGAKALQMKLEEAVRYDDIEDELELEHFANTPESETPTPESNVKPSPPKRRHSCPSALSFFKPGEEGVDASLPTFHGARLQSNNDLEGLEAARHPTA